MARRSTRDELERKILMLEAAQEGMFILQQAALEGRAPTIETFSNERFNVKVVGLDRLSGGVIIAINDIRCCIYVCNWCHSQETGHADPYARDIASKLRRAQKDAVERRSA